MTEENEPCVGEGVSWMGRDIRELSKTELIVVVLHLMAAIESTRESLGKAISIRLKR